MDKKIMGKISGKDKLKPYLLVTLLICLFVSFDCHAASRDTELFESGYGHYLSYQPQKAVEEFRMFLKEFPQSSSKDAVLFWLGRSLMQLKEYQEAGKVFTDLKRQFPESPFVSHAEKELEAIGKAGHSAVKVMPSQSVRNSAEEKGGTGIEGKKEATQVEEKQKTGLAEEKKKPEELTARVKGPEKDGGRTEESQAEPEDFEDSDEETDLAPEEPEIVPATGKEPSAPEIKAGELQEGKKKTEAEKAKMKGPEEEKKTAKVLQDKGKGITDEKKKTENLQAKISGPEGKEAYLLNSSVVLNKLGMKDVLWRSGDIREDMMTENVLYQEAKKLNISADTARHKALTERYKFNKEQQAYLERYLTICNFIDLKLEDIPAENVFEQLIIEYDEDTRYTKIVLAPEIQAQAKSGMSFDEIYSLYPDLITYRVSGFGELPGWIQEKVASIPAGELGVLWSENGYRVLKRTLKKFSLKACEETRPETKDKIKLYITDLLKKLKGVTKRSEHESEGNPEKTGAFLRLNGGQAQISSS